MSLDSVADTFSFSFNAAETGTYCRIFHSSDGEEYNVNVNMNIQRDYYYNTSSGRYDGKCTIKWKNMSNKFIRLRNYKEVGNEVLSDKKLFVKCNELSAVFEFNIPIITQLQSTVVVVVIGIIPYENVPKCKDDLSLLQKQDLKSTNKEPTIEKRLEQLSTDMKSLLQKGNLSDVVLTDGETDVHVHKVVLSVRSSVFAKMLKHPMKEKRENRITIKDISIKVLRGLLEFMYTGTAVIKDMEMARNLYIAADKYDVQSLKTICAKELTAIDLHNVIDTLLLADLYSDTMIKKASLNFIANNYSQLKTLQNWYTFMKNNQMLAIEILSFVLDKKI